MQLGLPVSNPISGGAEGTEALPLILSARNAYAGRERSTQRINIDGKKKIDGKQYAKKCSAEEDV